MTKNQRNLINWWECIVCNQKDKGKQLEWTIMKGQICLPTKEKFPAGEMAFIKLCLKNSLGKQHFFEDRISHYCFVRKHWNCSSDGTKLVSWNDYNDYWDNFNHHGIWIFDYLDDPKEMKRLRFDVLKELGHYNE